MGHFHGEMLMEAMFFFFWKFGEPQRHGFLDLPDKEREKVPEVLAKVRPKTGVPLKDGNDGMGSMGKELEHW